MVGKVAVLPSGKEIKSVCRGQDYCGRKSNEEMSYYGNGLRGEIVLRGTDAGRKRVIDGEVKGDQYYLDPFSRHKGGFRSSSQRCCGIASFVLVTRVCCRNHRNNADIAAGMSSGNGHMSLLPLLLSCVHRRVSRSLREALGAVCINKNVSGFLLEQMPFSQLLINIDFT